MAPLPATNLPWVYSGGTKGAAAPPPRFLGANSPLPQDYQKGSFKKGEKGGKRGKKGENMVIIFARQLFCPPTKTHQY